jgi:tight adherence protein B
MNPAVVGILITVVFVGVLLTGSFLYWTLASRRVARSHAMARRLGSLSNTAQSNNLFQQQEIDPLVDALGGVGRHLDNLARQSGSNLTASTLAGQIAASALGAAVVMGVLAGAKGALLGLIVGVIPWMQVRSKAEQRTIRLSEQLPDALDLLSRSLQAGHGIADAMKTVATEMTSPLADEFGRVYEEHNLGRDFRDCMTEMALRNPHNFDLRIVVSATLLQRETGGNLVEIFTNIAATIRARFIFKGKVRALTAEARMSASILGALPFVVAGALMFLRPDYLTPLLTEPAGRTLLMACALLFVAGVALMRSLAQVEA